MMSLKNWDKRLVQVLFFLIYTFWVNAQDTVFVQKYTFDQSVNNIDGDGKNIIARTANHLYLLGNDGFKEIRNVDLSGGRYSWIQSGNQESEFKTINSNFLLPEKRTGKEFLHDLLPGFYHPTITKAVKGKNLFISYKGSILEYEVRKFYKIEHKGKSVRCVYNDDSIKITATYSGVFVDSSYAAFAEISMAGGDYSNGEVCKIKGKYYMCKDNIWVLGGNRWRPIQRSSNSRLADLDEKEGKDYLKLNEHLGKVYVLGQRFVGIIDLEAGIIKDTLFYDHGALFDMKWIGDQLMIAAENGYLYLLNDDQDFQEIYVGSCIYDINVKGDVAILSCKDGVYKYYAATKRVKKMFDLVEAVQSLYVEKKLLVSSFNGLFVFDDQKLFTLLPMVEFNKYALSQWEGSVFAGSIEGLYVIDRGVLIHDVIPSLTPQVVSTTTASTYINVFLISLVFLFGILYFTIRKRQKKLQVEVIKRTKITPESIRQLILQNEQIISVEAVADHFATSTVQLNRILKRYNTSGLKLLKEIKGEIVLDMIEKQTPLDKISNRVGYSIAYIKRNYLKKLD